MNNPYTPLLSFLAGGTVMLQVLIGLGIFILLISFFIKKQSFVQKISKYIGENAVAASLLVATMATVSSLFLSEVAGFPPCKLCWFQRIFMYPQVIVLGAVLLLNDMKARIIALILSIIGFVIAVYHILVQFFPASFKCSDEIANCALKSFTYYGYITIPVMSATTFLMIIVLLIFSFRTSKNLQ